MLSCNEAARLVSDGLERKQPFWRRLSLRLHVMMCSSCRAYRRQVEALDKLIGDRFSRGTSLPVDPSTALSDDARLRIKAAVRGHAD